MTFGGFLFLAIMNKAATNILIKKRFPGWLPLPPVSIIPQKQLKFAPKELLCTPQPTQARLGPAFSVGWALGQGIQVLARLEGRPAGVGLGKTSM